MQKEGPHPDVLTFAGNGEPTLHPAFPEIVDDTIRLRNQYCPEARISVLSNSTQIHRPNVRKALMRTDNPIMKLDTVSEEYIRRLDRPQGHYSTETVIAHLAEMSPQVIVQTMFLAGLGLDNTGDEYVDKWLKAVKDISPEKGMIYTIDRETPAHGLIKASHEELDAICEKVKAAGIDCSASY